ncbi:MAG: sensor domain-containing diguanylate cyclase [Myxococcales bacterium]|nr:GGDEF domain-containing protein [Sorangiineae bacterium PRO1]MCL4752325.1 sensor domain-containing diguanylate cyclase [Myxococcales bacterium]
MSELPRTSDLRGLMLRAVDVATSLQLRAREDRVFRAVTEKINAGVYLEDIADHVYESFRELIPYERIGLALLEQGDQVLRARWARAEYDAKGIQRGFAAPMKGSSLERILQTKKPRIINDLEAYYASHPSSEATGRILSEGVRSSLTCPLVTAGRPVGFLFFSSLKKGSYDGAHVQVFQEIANTLSVVVERAHMLEQLAQLNLDLAAKNRELRAANARVRRMTVTDPLTRIANRRGLITALRMAASFSDRRRVPLSVISFDVDHFKRVNDSFGHDAGDRVLRHVARVATACCRREDLAGRAGGEEFLVVLPATSESEAAVVAERLRARLEATSVRGTELRVTASFGVAQRQPGEALDSLLVRADRALYAAKGNGRDRVALFSELGVDALAHPPARAG